MQTSLELQKELALQIDLLKDCKFNLLELSKAAIETRCNSRSATDKNNARRIARQSRKIAEKLIDIAQMCDRMKTESGEL